MNMTATNMDVAEVYSPERVTTMAKKMGLNAGWALDLTTTDELGRNWDFDCVHMRNKATRKLLEDRPMLLIGSPMCTEFCAWSHLNHFRMPKEVVTERIRKSTSTLRILHEVVQHTNTPWQVFSSRTPTGGNFME